MPNTIDKENIARNRKIWESIVDAIILCGQQCLPLCGHHDDSTAFDDVDHNPGNFVELLRFRYSQI